MSGKKWIVGEVAFQDRMPPLSLEAMNDDQRKAAEELIAGPRKGVKGPFIPLIRSPELMDKLQKEIAKLSAELSDPELYQRDPAKFEKTSAALSVKSAELAAAAGPRIARPRCRQARYRRHPRQQHGRVAL